MLFAELTTLGLHTEKSIETSLLLLPANNAHKPSLYLDNITTSHAYIIIVFHLEVIPFNTVLDVMYPRTGGFP